MEKKIYLIKAYEGIYYGLHGIISYAVVETTYDGATDIARDMSYDLMESHSNLFYEDFKNDAESEGLEGEELDSYIEECYEENIAYEIYEVIGRDDEDVDDLDKEMARYPDRFIKEYCNCV